MSKVISVEGISKRYRLGQLGADTFYQEFEDWLSQLTKKDAKPKDLTSDYIWALKDVSFTVDQGQVVGVIGRNGSGKSTLLKVLSRITSPTIGRVRLKGRLASLLEVGTGFHPELTGRENIFLNGAILGMTKTEINASFDEIVDFAEVKGFIETPVKRYSSGMYVRLAFSVAAHLRPEILLVDEVLAVGDAEFQRKCIQKMKSVSEVGRTVLFVSHNLASVAELCTTAILLSGGHLAKYGQVNEVIETYMLSGQRSIAETIFAVDKTKAAQVVRLRVLDREQNPAAIVNSKDDFYLEARVSVYEPLRGTMLFHLRTASGVWVLQTTAADFLQKMHTLKAGDRVIYLAKIPGGLLNEGSYTFHANFLPGSIGTYDTVQSQPFEITKAREQTRYIGERIKDKSVLRLSINWEFTKITGRDE